MSIASVVRKVVAAAEELKEKMVVNTTKEGVEMVLSIVCSHPVAVDEDDKVKKAA